jgi:hypothetical protein
MGRKSMIRWRPAALLRAITVSSAVVFSFALPVEAASPYVKCVQKVQKKHKAVSRVIPLEGVSKGLSLQTRTNSSFLGEEQSAELSAAFDGILKCREKVLKKASRYPDALAIMNDVFGKFDIVYVDLQQKRVSIGIASVALVNMRNEAEVNIKRIEAGIIARNAEEARRNSADGWKLMQQGLDMLYPPVSPPSPNPTYKCRDYGSYTRCTPSN